MNDLIKALVGRGFSESDAKDAYASWYNWVVGVTSTNSGKFETTQLFSHNQMTIRKGIEVHSICKRHLLPKTMMVHVGYVSGDHHITNLVDGVRHLAYQESPKIFAQHLVDRISKGVSAEWCMVVIDMVGDCSECEREGVNFTRVTAYEKSNECVHTERHIHHFMDTIGHG